MACCIYLSIYVLFSFRVLLGLRVTGVTVDQRDYQDSLVEWELRAALVLEHLGSLVRRASLVYMACKGILEIQV